MLHHQGQSLPSSVASYSVALQWSEYVRILSGPLAAECTASLCCSHEDDSSTQGLQSPNRSLGRGSLGTGAERWRSLVTPNKKSLRKCCADAVKANGKGGPAAHALEYRFGSRQPLGFTMKSEANIAY